MSKKRLKKIWNVLYADGAGGGDAAADSATQRGSDQDQDR